MGWQTEKLKSYKHFITKMESVNKIDPWLGPGSGKIELFDPILDSRAKHVSKWTIMHLHLTIVAWVIRDLFKIFEIPVSLIPGKKHEKISENLGKNYHNIKWSKQSSAGIMMLIGMS